MSSGLSSREEARLEKFLEPARIAVIATIGKTGVPQLTPNWYRFAEGRLTFSTTKERAKYRNLARDKRLTVCIYAEPMAQDYAVLSGEVEIRDDPSIWPETEAIVQRYAGSGAVDEMMERLRAENRVIVSMVPKKVVFREV